jgi:hypothetical protein
LRALPRDPVSAHYFGRLVYGAAWTTLCYCRPIYHAVLLLPPLKWVTFRLFGYRGAGDFTTYPGFVAALPAFSAVRAWRLRRQPSDHWHHMVMADGRILVGPVTLGERATFGHLSMVAAQ